MKNKGCCEATKEEIKENNRCCWWTDCRRTSRLERCGWKYCFKHSFYTWFSDYKISLKSIYYFIKSHKLIIKH